MNALDTMNMLRCDPEGTAAEAADRFLRASGVEHCDIMLIAGTGWNSAIDALGPMNHNMLVTDLPGFLPAVADGHRGMLGWLRIGQHNVCVSDGRTHGWEFKGGWLEAMPALLHRVHVAHKLGCKTIIHTSAVGGLTHWARVGDLMLVNDFNDQVTGVPSPLLGGPNHLDVTRVYDRDLLNLCRNINPRLNTAVLATVLGPHFQSHAVARYLSSNGVEIVGMSGIIEAIQAHFFKIRNLAMGVVTDAAGDPVTSDEVQRIVRELGPELGAFVRQVIERM